MTRSHLVIVALSAASLALATSPAAAQRFGVESSSAPSSENIAGFTVAGKGTAAARPNKVEIELEVSAASELSADAIVKYRDAKKRLEDAFAALKLGNVAVEERGLLVDQKGQSFNPYYMDTPPARRGKIEVQLSRKLVVTCKDIRSMDEEAILQLVARLLDVAQDAGAKVGGNPNDAMMAWWYGYPSRNQNGLVKFVLDDFAPLQEKAYEQAVADARTRAGRLAKLSGVELGPVVGVREIVVPGERVATPDDEVPRKRLESAKFQEIPVKVELQVRFEVAANHGVKPREREAGQ